MRPLALTPEHLARAFRVVPAPENDHIEGWRKLTDPEITEAAEAMLAGRPEGPLYVFAYGSLLWNPGFPVARRIRAVAAGWHREFSIEINSFRGTPDAPGLMLALMPGGSCTGLLLEADEATVLESAEALVRREMPWDRLVGQYRWLRTRTAQGPVTALTFYASPDSERLRKGLAPEETARILARACGYAGSGAEYVAKTVAALEEAGISDRPLWRLQHLIAAEIDAMEGV